MKKEKMKINRNRKFYKFRNNNNVNMCPVIFGSLDDFSFSRKGYKSLNVCNINLSPRCYPSGYAGLSFYFKNLEDGRFFKELNLFTFSNLRIVNMLPGDLLVAGCFPFSKSFGGGL